MATGITQITTYPVTPEDGEATKLECVKEALKVVESADGWIRAYNGVQTTSSRRLGFWIFDWESAAHRKAFLADDAHAPVLAALRASAMSPEADADTQNKTGSLQVQLDPPHAPEAFGAPLTEIAVGTLRNGTEHTVCEALMRRVMEAARCTKGALGAGWGKVIADEGEHTGRIRYVLVVGWESVEAHEASVTARAAHELQEEVNALAEYEIRLVKLNEYEKGSAA